LLAPNFDQENFSATIAEAKEETVGDWPNDKF